MTKSKQAKEPMSGKEKLYWTVGIVVAILVVILLVWNTGIFTKSQTAATVGDQSYSVAEVSYYYQAVANSTIQQAQTYSAYGIDMGYDTSLSPSEQYYDEDAGTTYADYFLETALDNLQQVSILCAEAEAAGYTLSEDGKASVQENMDTLTNYAVKNGTTDSAYLKLLYGRYMTKSLFEEMITNAVLAEDYAAAKAEEFTYSDSELETYYQENAADLDSYSYRYCYINYETEEQTDEDGNTIDPTDEEIAAAMTVAGQNADAMVAQVRSGTEFNTAAVEYLDESSAESYSDPDYNLYTDVLGSSFSGATYTDWLQDSSRQVGDITSLEVEDVGYCVVQFLGRTKGDDLYQTMSYRNILILAETTPSEDDETEALPTDEQLTAAMDQAQALLDQWNAGDATADSFAALAQENSADETTKDNGGLNEEADRSSLSSDITDWLFTSGRQIGDSTVVPSTDDSGNVIGYEVLYVEGFGQIRWQYQATTTLRSDDYDEWYNGILENYPAELTEVGQTVPSLS